MRIDMSDTICAAATTPGSGAISLIRLSGPDCFSIADKVVRLRRGTVKDCPGYSIRFGIVPNGDEVLDEVLVSVFHAPHSYTGEDCVEISCHASAYIVTQLLTMLCSAGARPAEAGEFTRRAFASGKMDLAQAEAVADLISSSSASAHRLAMQQLKGSYSDELKKLRGQMLELTSLLELELDFSEEEVEFADRSRLVALAQAVNQRMRALADSFRNGNAIRNGIPVAIVGAPNTGKSTLLNALLGDDRAIVSDIAGTTRDTIEETMTIGGFLFRFIDTAGLHETEEQIERMGIERSLRSLERADVVIGMLDATVPEEERTAAANLIREKIDAGRQTLIMLLNKCDMLSEAELKALVCRPLEEDCMAFSARSGLGLEKDCMAFSARSGLGLEELRERLVESQRKRISSAPGDITVTNIRHFNELNSASEALERVLSGLSIPLPSDLVAEDLRDALYHIGAITGEVSNEEVLGEIFGRFCIGK